MNIFDAFPSKYVKAADLKGREIELTIASVAVEDVGDGRKPIVYFDGVKKGLLLNRVNSGTIADAYSPETDNWTGRPIVLFPTTCEYRGSTVDCIRLKIPKIVPVAVTEVVSSGSDPFTPQQQSILTPAGNGRKSVIQL